MAPEPSEIACYVNAAEWDSCEQWHEGAWPDCDHESHDFAKTLLDELGEKAEKLCRVIL